MIIHKIHPYIGFLLSIPKQPMRSNVCAWGGMLSIAVSIEMFTCIFTREDMFKYAWKRGWSKVYVEYKNLGRESTLISILYL